jgi:hypothetical protein
VPAGALAADTTPPHIIDHTGAWQNIPGPALVLNTEVTDDSGVRPTVTVNGTTVPDADWHGDSFTYRYVFPALGVNPIQYVATDGAGNQSTFRPTYHVLDPAVPKLSRVSVDRRRVRLRASRAGFVSIEVQAERPYAWMPKSSAGPAHCGPNPSLKKKNCHIYDTVGTRLAPIAKGSNTLKLPSGAVPGGSDGRNRYQLWLQPSVTRELITPTVAGPAKFAPRLFPFTIR